MEKFGENGKIDISPPLLEINKEWENTPGDTMIKDIYHYIVEYEYSDRKLNPNKNLKQKLLGIVDVDQNRNLSSKENETLCRKLRRVNIGLEDILNVSKGVDSGNFIFSIRRVLQNEYGQELTWNSDNANAPWSYFKRTLVISQK